MTPVSVYELKVHLSRYLREVRRGGEVQVLDQGPLELPADLRRAVDEDRDDRL